MHSFVNMTIQQKLADTSIGIAINALDKVYNYIEEKQQKWILHAPVQCPSGCGECCVDFEPDLLECEALYLACWLLQNKPSVATSIIDGTFVPYRNNLQQTACTNVQTAQNASALCKDADAHPKGCILFDPNTPYHCTVYGGRNLICRLFGYACDTDKNGCIRWKKCRFNPNSASVPRPDAPAKDGRILLEEREYSQEEILQLCGALPPVMKECMAQALAIMPDNTSTTPLRDALPRALKKITQILSLIEDNTSDNTRG